MKTNIKDRLTAYIKHSNISTREFERRAGLSNGYMNSLRQSPTAEKMQSIIEAFPDLDRSWLLTGEGSMLREGAPSTPPAEESTNFRFRLPVTAEAGTLIGISEGVTPADCERVPRIFALPDYDNTILISGNSMSPKYESGDEVAIKRAKNIMWGYVYVLDTTDGIVIKRIYDNGKSIRCNSYNPEYPDFEIPKEDVYGAFRVIGIIRRGEM